MNRAISILRLKCPKCSKGDLFTKKGLLRYSQILEMHENCSNCGQKYCIEPGFWLGSLWTSYPIIIITELPFLLCALIIDSVNPFWFFGGMILAFILVYPVMLRLGRSIWIHLNIRAEKKS